MAETTPPPAAPATPALPATAPKGPVTPVAGVIQPPAGTPPVRRGNADTVMRSNLAAMAKAALAGKDPSSGLEPAKPADGVAPETPPAAPSTTPTKQPEAKTPDAKPVETPSETPAETKVRKSILDRDAKAATPPVSADSDPAGPEDKIALPDDAAPEKVSQFKELKTITKTLRRQIADMQKDQDRQKTIAPADAAELDRLKTQMKVYADRLAILDVASTPEFRNQFVKPREAAVAEAKEVLSYTPGKDGTDVAAILAMPPKEFRAAVSELTKDMNSMDAAIVQNSLRTAQKLRTEESQALAQSGELAKQIATKNVVQQKEAFSEISGKLGPMGEFLVTLDIPDGVSTEEKAAIEDYNRSVSDVRLNAERYAFGETDVKQAATLAWKGATLDFLLNHGVPRMEKEYRALLDNNTALRRELEGIKSARRSPTAGSDPQTTAKPAPTGTRQSINDLVKSAWQGGR